MTERVLLLNWRDPWHPRAGGAELVTLRIAERLVARGYAVEWFSSTYPGAAPTEIRDGISYVREGSESTVHLAAFRRYAKRTDLEFVVDQVNTIPFYAMRYRSGRKIVFFHQLAREVWLYEGGLLGPIGFLAEPLYLLPYRSRPIITVSESSKSSLEQIGMRGHITVIPECVDEAPVEDVHTKPSEDIVIVSRLARSKRIDHGIEAAALMKARGWSGTLHVVGAAKDAAYGKSLARLAADRLGDYARLWGRVSDERRRELQQRASMSWMTSVREGWGLVVTEAARLGTASVVYDVPGLREAVIDGETGYVVEPTPVALAEASLKMLAEGARSFGVRARDASLRFTWDATADAFEQALRQHACP